MASLGSLADWILAAAATVGTGLTTLAGLVGSNRKRSKRNKRRLVGDSDDPNDEGVLQIANDTRERVSHLEDKMDDQHRQVRDRLEDVADAVESDD